MVRRMLFVLGAAIAANAAYAEATLTLDEARKLA